MTPCFFSPVRTSRILVLFASSILTLSLDTIGIPRQVKKGDPNKVAVGGGTPRRVHSRAKGATALGWARKNDGSFQTLVINSSRSSGDGRPWRVLIFCESTADWGRPYSFFLISAPSWRSFTRSIKSLNCSWIWSIGLL